MLRRVGYASKITSVYPSRREWLVTRPLLPVMCLYVPLPSDTHTDLGLKRFCVGSALTIVPRLGKSNDVSIALYEISSAITRSSSARFSIVDVVDMCSSRLVVRCYTLINGGRLSEL